MELEVGYGLIKLVDKKQGGDLLDRITNMRRQIAGDLGISIQTVARHRNQVLNKMQVQGDVGLVRLLLPFDDRV